MAVKIRLSRVGRKKEPVYRIVVIDSRAKRNGRSLEWVGTYDPIKDKLLKYAPERVIFWEQQGAQVSDAVKKITRVHGPTFVAAVN